MEKIYIEDLFQSEEELSSLVLSKIRSKLKNKYFIDFCKDHMEYEIGANTGNNHNFFFVYNYFTVSLNRNDEWVIDMIFNSSDGPLSSMLCNVRKNNGLEDILSEYKIILSAVKEVIRENTLCHTISTDRVDGFIKRCELLFLLKNKLEEVTNLSFYWSGEDLELFLRLPSDGIGILICEEDNAKLEVERGDIFLPYDKMKDNNTLLDSYFEEYDLLSLISNIQLRNTFSLDSGGSLDYHLKSIMAFNAKEVFENKRDKDIDYIAAYKTANPNVDLCELAYSSTVVCIPSDYLDAPTELRSQPGFTSAIKTEDGVYYLKGDKKTLAFSKLDDIYVKFNEVLSLI